MTHTRSDSDLKRYKNICIHWFINVKSCVCHIRVEVQFFKQNERKEITYLLFQGYTHAEQLLSFIGIWIYNLSQIKQIDMSKNFLF